jgi:hypothetical protein
VRKMSTNLRPFSRQEEAGRQPRDESFRVVTYNVLANKFALGG